MLLGGIGFGLMSRQWEKTAFPFSGEAAVYKVCLREHPEEKERSLLCRVALLEEFRQDTMVRHARKHRFLAYFPNYSASSALRRGD